LAYLGTHALAHPRWQAQVRGESRPLAASTAPEVEATIVNERALPPLVRGYLRLGARFSDHAAIDHDLGVTDVLAILPIEWIGQRYIAYFGADPAP
jgi:putative hemolysin